MPSFQAGNDAPPVAALLRPLHPLRHRHGSGFQVNASGASQRFRKGEPHTSSFSVLLFLVKFFFFFSSHFSDSNDERESSPPDKEEAQEKAGKTEPSFARENSRFLKQNSSPSPEQPPHRRCGLVAQCQDVVDRRTPVRRLVREVWVSGRVTAGLRSLRP